MSKLDADAFEAMSPKDRTLVLDTVRRGANRREVLAMLGLAGMGLAMGGSVFTGATRAFAAEPKRGGSIRVASYAASTADTLDPAKASNASDYTRCNFFYNGLTTIDESGAPQPALAETFETKDAKVWVFKLRKGVTFHDGKSFTSKDVLYSLKRHLDPAIGSKAQKLAAQMAEISANGDAEVQITLTGANADFPTILGTSQFLIVPDGTTDFSKGVGTGPFKLGEFQPGVRTIALRNENYWRPNAPYLDQIEFFGLADEQARVNALMSGDVQLASTINPRSLAVIEGAGAFDVLRTDAGNYTNLIIRLDEGPGQNSDFVMGMKYLTNREQIQKAIFRGYAEVANDQPIPKSNRFHADLPQRAFDPDKAKFHFEKAGVLGQTIPIVASPAADNSVEMATLLQQEAKKVGFTLDIQRVPSDGFWSNYWMKSPVGFGNINPRPTADLLLSLFYLSDADWNESRWKNPKFDQLVVGARAETDDAKRKQMYHDAQALIHDESGVIIPAFTSNLDVHSKTLKGMKPMTTGPMMGFAFGEHVWLDA
ncbi:ABC transporter substrate-binding protein [Aureimonas sp. AU40]|uniref:ABC transporter substrate-binding protein n=1 Tax=Aureimonas sp. AU40 TaxID=1637747 RepID=UPI000782E197